MSCDHLEFDNSPVVATIMATRLRHLSMLCMHADLKLPASDDCLDVQ